MDDREYIRLPTLDKKRTQLYAREVFGVFSRRAGQPEVAADVLPAITRKLGLSSREGRVAVRASVGDVVGKPFRRLSARRCAYRLAVNRQRLVRGWACPYMPAVVPEAWEHAIIADVVHVQHVLRAKPRISLAYRILSGPVAGVQVLENANASFGSVLFRLCAGYPRGVRYETPLQLIGLRLGVSLGNAGGRLAVKGHDISSGLVPVNAKLTRSRLRVLAVCPFGGTVDCVLCPVGRNECKRSMNPESTQLIV